MCEIYISVSIPGDQFDERMRAHVCVFQGYQTSGISKSDTQPRFVFVHMWRVGSGSAAFVNRQRSDFTQEVFQFFFTGSSHIEGFRKPNRRVSVSQPRAEHSGWWWWYFRTTVATDQFEFLFFLFWWFVV